MTMSFPLLPMWSQIAWTVALSAVLAAHLRHAWGMRGQARWWHVSHVTMLAGMIVMYFPPSMTSHWFAAVRRPCLVVFGVVAVTLVTTALMTWARERNPNPLWLLAALDSVAMAYMWLPHGLRPGALTWAIVAYCALGTIAWLAGLWSRPVYRTVTVAEPQAQAILAGRPGAEGSAGLAEPSAAAVREPRHALSAHNTIGTRVTLAVMTASMAYMLLAML